MWRDGARRGGLAQDDVLDATWWHESKAGRVITSRKAGQSEPSRPNPIPWVGTFV
jgi:hypothetical protein